MTYEKFKAMIEALLAKLKGQYGLSLVAELGAGEEWVVTCTQLGAFFLRYYVDNAIVTDKIYSLADEMMPILWELYPHEWRLAGRVFNPTILEPKMPYEEFKAMIEALLAKLKGQYGLSLGAEVGNGRVYVIINGAESGNLHLQNYLYGEVAGVFYASAEQIIKIAWELYPHEWQLAQRGFVS